MSAFDWILPAWLRKRKPVADKTALALLAGMRDDDPTLAVLMELVGDQAEYEAQQALSPVVLSWMKDGTPIARDEAQSRAYQCGRAAALAGLIERIESARAEAREWANKESERVKTKGQ